MAQWSWAPDHHTVEACSNPSLCKSFLIHKNWIEKDLCFLTIQYNVKLVKYKFKSIKYKLQY